MSDQRVTTVTFAINLIDYFTRKRPIDQVEVSIKDSKIKCVRNLSGFYVFINIPRADYQVVVKSRFYFEEEVKVLKSELERFKKNKEDPVIHVELKPLPSYPFPPGTTLIRGIVHDSKNKPIPNATVEVVKENKKQDDDLTNQTTEKGDFAIFFRKLAKNDVKPLEISSNGKKIRKWYIKIKNDIKVPLRVTRKPQKKDILLEEGVEEGQVTAVKGAIILK